MVEPWRQVRLGDVAHRISAKNAFGLQRILTVAAGRGLVDQQSFFTRTIASADTASYLVVEKDDLVYNKSTSRGAPFGVVARHVSDSPGVVTPLYIVFRADQSVTSPQYLELACNSNAFFASLRGALREGARSHGLLNVRLQDFLAATLPLPPVSEQRRIVDLVGSVDEQIRALLGQSERAADLLDALRSQEFSQLSSSRDLRSVMTQVRSGGTPSRENPRFYGGNVPWLKSGEVASPWITTTAERITEDGLANSSAWLVPAGSVVVAMYGATASEVGYLAAPMATNQAVLAFVPDPLECDGRFVYHWLRHHAVRLKQAATGAAQPNLSKTVILREVGFPVIGLREQRTIVEMLDAAELLAARLSEEARDGREYRSQLVEALLRQEVVLPDHYDTLLEAAR